jgi:hypothetical protein
MHEMARLSARERQQLIGDFVARVFAGVGPETPGASIATRMRQLPAELPDDPAPEQVDAWIELAGLVTDDSFRARVRLMAQAGRQAQPQDQPPALDYRAVQQAGQALADGVQPGSRAGQAVLDQLIPAAERPGLLAQLETFTDGRVERYWQLLAVLNQQPPFPPTVPAYQWLIAALRASG